MTADQITAIEKASGEKVRSPKVVAFVGPNKEAVLIDQVLGKHEFITIAVGIGSEVTIRGVEILEYRETYGYQVRNPEWRKQFTGKNGKRPSQNQLRYQEHQWRHAFIGSRDRWDAPSCADL